MYHRIPADIVLAVDQESQFWDLVSPCWFSPVVELMFGEFLELLELGPEQDRRWAYLGADMVSGSWRVRVVSFHCV
jgi:hypothetical protein